VKLYGDVTSNLGDVNNQATKDLLKISGISEEEWKQFQSQKAGKPVVNVKVQIGSKDIKRVMTEMENESNFNSGRIDPWLNNTPR